MNWEPAHADHSIESVNAIISLSAPIDQNIFDEVLVAGRKAATAHQLTHRIEGIEPLQIAPGSEVVINLMGAQTSRRVGFQRLADGKAISEFAIGATSFAFASSHYSSWTDFVAMLKDLLKPVDAIAGVLGQVKTLQLQYIDRFASAGDTVNAFEIVSGSSAFLAPSVGKATKAFHSHIGWFDYLDDAVRRLTNVNIDMVDSFSTGEPINRLSILTMARLETRAEAFKNPLDELNGMHYYLKELFQGIITEQAATRVHLND